MRSACTIVAVVVDAGLLAETSLAVTTPDPRSLPSLVIRWKLPGRVENVELHDGTAYVLGEGRVTAVDPIKGTTLWTQQYTLSDQRGPLGPFFFEDKLLVSIGDKVFEADAKSGKLLHSIDLGGFVGKLAGPPWFPHCTTSRRIGRSAASGRATYYGTGNRRGILFEDLDPPRETLTIDGVECKRYAHFHPDGRLAETVLGKPGRFGPNTLPAGSLAQLRTNGSISHLSRSLTCESA